MMDRFKELRDKIGPLLRGSDWCNECRDWYCSMNYIKCPDCYPVKILKPIGVVHWNTRGVIDRVEYVKK